MLFERCLPKEATMSVSSILLTGRQSLQASINRTAIAGSGLNVENDDFASKMVAMRQGEIEAKAAANVVKAADQILGTIIGIRG
jgi:outer membrane murein-binding lipoprotein Lpp